MLGFFELAAGGLWPESALLGDAQEGVLASGCSMEESEASVSVRALLTAADLGESLFFFQSGHFFPLSFFLSFFFF